MQSIGRGLGLSELKDKYILYDVTDQFDIKLASNRIYLQGLQRIKIYKEQQWKYNIIEEHIGQIEHIDPRIVEFVYSKKQKERKEKKQAKKRQAGALSFEEQDLFKQKDI